MSESSGNRQFQQSFKMGLGSFCKQAAWFFFDYTTPKLVTIRSLKIGLINRLTQLAIVAYIIGYVLVYQKGYQDPGVGDSAVTSKLKGIASTLHRDELPAEYRRIWDTADYSQLENNAFFVMTNAIITTQQRNGTCSEDPARTEAHCKNDTDCTKGKVVPNGNGIETGKCNQATKTCMIDAWCPTEKDELPRNIVNDYSNKSYLTACLYDSETDQLCPKFRLGDVVQYALQNKSNFTELAKLGGVIGIRINWNCDLDWNIDRCKPTYQFSRLDDPDVKIAVGWNFRESIKYRFENGTEYRDLIKKYGILFVISVRANAGKFSFIPLVLKIGSTIALLSLATVIGDVILLYVLQSRKYYSNKKYLKIVDEDFARLTNSDQVGVLEDDTGEAPPSQQRSSSSSSSENEEN